AKILGHDQIDAANGFFAIERLSRDEEGHRIGKSITAKRFSPPAQRCRFGYVGKTMKRFLTATRYRQFRVSAFELSCGRNPVGVGSSPSTFSRVAAAATLG